jgi:hypothetical protein
MRERYDVGSLIERHGRDAKLTDLLATLADCEGTRAPRVHDRRKAVYERR